ncbi:hypothetical protein Tco_0898426 [Tanacetum coccineum]
MDLDNDGIESKTTKEKVKSLALKAKVTREQTSDDSDSQGGSNRLVIVLIGSKRSRKYFGTMEGKSLNKARLLTPFGIEAPLTMSGQSPRRTSSFVGRAEVIVKTLDIVDLQKDNEELLSRVNELDLEVKNVVFGSNVKGKVVGGCNITHDSITITNVEHVSGLAVNFISVGLDVCVDLTGSSPLTQTGMVDFVPGRAVIDATHRKRVKYEAKCADIGYGFLPFSFSSLGEL